MSSHLQQKHRCERIDHGCRETLVCVEAAADRSRRCPCPLPSSFSDKTVIIRDLTLQLFPTLTSVHNNRSAEPRWVLRSLKVFLEVLGFHKLKQLPKLFFFTLIADKLAWHKSVFSGIQVSIFFFY